MYFRGKSNDNQKNSISVPETLYNLKGAAQKSFFVIAEDIEMWLTMQNISLDGQGGPLYGRYDAIS